MTKNSLVLTILLLLNTPALAQHVDTTWVRRYNGPGNHQDIANAMAVDDCGNVYVTGWSYTSETVYDYATVKYDSLGNQLWARIYNGPGNNSDQALAIAVDDCGNVYVTGEENGGGLGDYTTIRYYPNGDTAWVRTYNGPGNGQDRPSAMVIDEIKNVYVTGTSQGSGTSSDYATVKYDSLGNELWVRRYNGSGDCGDGAGDLAVDAWSNVYVTGGNCDTVWNSDYATIKYDADGNELWVREYEGPINGGDAAHAIAIDDSGNIYVTGHSHGGTTSTDYATVKYDSSGNQLWVARYNGTGNEQDIAYAIAIDVVGNVYVTGKSWGGPRDYDYATIRYDSSGNQLWVRRYETNLEDWPWGMAVDDSCSVYVTGTTGSTYPDYATVKYDSSGNERWIQSYNGPADQSDKANAIAADASGNIFVTGTSYSGVETSEDYTTIKYRQNHFPVVTAPDSAELLCEPDTVDFTVTATDRDAGDTLTLSGPGIPTPIKGVSPVSADIKIYVSSGGTYDYVYTVTDNRSGSDSDTATWSITLNNPPTAVAPDSFELLCEPGSIGFTVIATDPDSGDTLNLSGPGIPDPIVGISPLSVEVNIYIDSAGAYENIYTVTDRCNGSDSDTATWIITINNPPAVTAPDSSEFLCGPDTIRFTVNATDPDLGDTLILSGPGISVPIKGVSPLSADINLHVGSAGTHDYVYIVTDTCNLSDSDTASWSITFNSPPDFFSLLSPPDNDYGTAVVVFDWEIAVDPNLGDEIRYDLHLSSSLSFHPDSTVIYDSLLTNNYTDSLDRGGYYWKVKAYDTCEGRWSTQTWSFHVFLRGDVNGDGVVDVGDVVYLVSYLYRSGPSPVPIIQVGDVNCDSVVNIGDVVYLINYLYRGGLPPYSD